MTKLAVAVALLVAAMFPAVATAAGQDVLDFSTVQKAAKQGNADAQKSLDVMVKKGVGFGTR
jgi:TPR repeat protein